MKGTSILTVTLLSAFMIPAIQQVAAASQAIDGVISDTMCGSKHMLHGKTDAECIQQCLKGKTSFALVTDKRIYTLVGKPQTLTQFAAKHVLVAGSVKDNTITVEWVREMKADMPADMPM